MRVLMLNYEFPPLGGGAANATKYLLKEFSKVNDLQIDLVTSSTGKFKIEKFSENVTIYSLNIGKNGELHNQSNKDLLVYSQKAYRFSKKLMKEKQYDLCHAFFGIPCGFIAKKLKLPYIVSLRGSDVPGYSAKYAMLDKMFFRRMSKNIWEDAKSVITNSKGLKDLALKTSEEQKIDVIFNGIDTQEFRGKKDYRKEKILKIVSGTRLIERKGFVYLIEALRGLRNVKLTLIGEGPEKKKLKDEAKKWGVDVEFLGFVEHDKISAVLEKQDLYVLPSLNEGMCNFTLEAMASGLPIVVTKVGGTKELLKGNGFAIEKKSVDDIREKVEIFLRERSLLEKMGKKSREIAEKMSWENIAKSYKKEYKKVLVKKPVLKKKRILMLNYEFPPLGGGGGVASKKLAEGFIAQGYEVDYVTTWFEGLKKFDKVDGINVYRVKVIGRKELPTATMQSMLSFPVAAYSKCVELCKKYDYEFINTQFAVPTGPLGVRISKKFMIPNILSMHGGDIYDPSKTMSPHNWWMFRKTINYVLKYSQFLCCQSSNTKENILKYYKPNKDVKIIPLPYEPYVFGEVSRKSLGLSDNKKYLVSIGRIVKRKGYEYLIKALAEIKDKEVEVIIISDGPEKENLIKLSKELKVEKRVHFTGMISEEKKFQYLAVSDVYVLSSLHEGFGIVLQEAMQEGLPIVATNHGGQVDFVKENKNGFLVDVGDYKAIARRVEEILSNKELYSKFSKANKEAIKGYRYDNIAKAYLEVVKR